MKIIRAPATSLFILNKQRAKKSVCFCIKRYLGCAGNKHNLVLENSV